jgi:predicted acyltransferase
MDAISIKTERFTSLDVFRGLTLCFMIIVNSPGSGADVYVPLDHAAWFGFTPTDLVFPSFLFAVGNALSFSKKKFQNDGAFLKKVFKRTLIIFLLGYLMYWFPFFHRTTVASWSFNDIAHTRIMGVLQRIAICYGVGALITHYLTARQVIITSVIILLAYWGILYLFGEKGQELSMLGNAGTRFDIFVMGNNHLYHDKGGSIAFDPEGLLSTLPAIANVTAGYLAGVFIQKQGKNYETVSRLCITGIVLVLIALFWAEFFPFAKQLWTSTFVLLTVGIDLALIGILIYMIEIKSWNRGVGFFLVFGKNPLFIYLLSELMFVVIAKIIYVSPGLSLYNSVNNIFFQKIFPGPFGTLVFAVSYMFLCWLVGLWLDKRKIYVRI